MKALLIVAIVFAALALISLIRVGVRARYSAEGFFAEARAGFITIPVYPAKEKEKKPEKPKEEKEKKKGGPLPPLRDILDAAGETLGRLRRKIRVDRLTVRYLSAAEDPYDAAMHFGTASAGAELIIRFLQSVFKVKKCDVATDVSFSGEGDTIYIDMALSLALWEIIYIALGLWPLVRIMLKTKKTDKKDAEADRKVDNNGKTADK